MSARNTLSNKAWRRRVREARDETDVTVARYEAVSHDEELSHADREAHRAFTRCAALARPHAACGALPIVGRANRSDARPGATARARRIRERRAALQLARRVGR